MAILSDRNYKKYAIRNPKNISQINIIDKWAKKTTMKKLDRLNNETFKKHNSRIFIIFL